ncbi:MAG: hypothetical protein K2O47_03665, partial [Muribaculaceae bacterium]|nr:hypothetical protein [Muribaculaceae bacterium]
MKKTLAIGLTCLSAISIGILADASPKDGPKKNVIDEVAWIVGDNAIYKSEIEEEYAQMRGQGISPGG